MLLYIGENFFHTSSAVTQHASPFPQAEQSFTFLVTPSIKQSMVVQITAVYSSRRVKEQMSWGQTGSEVELNGPMALHLMGGGGIFLVVKCLSDVGRVELRCDHLYALSKLFCKRGVLGLGFQSELFRCKEFPANLVESFLSH